MLADGFTMRDVRRNQWRHLSADEAIRAALDWLEGEGWVRPEATAENPAGGRPTVRYRINPALPRKAADR
jgi:CRISPR/Cas system-associated protein Csm6